MQKVVVASKNPVKITAVRIGFEKMFPGQVFEYSGVSVPSHVSDQPMSDEETLRGAQNRVANAAQLIADADFVVGIEGGVAYIGDEMSAFAWIVVQSKKIQGKAKSATFFLPLQVSSLIKEGKELGEADDIVFQRTNSKQENGSVGILTGDVINRTSYYGEAVILALIPHKNLELYK